MVARALEYTELGTTAQRILARSHLSDGIEEFTVHAPVIAAAAQAGQFVRVLPRADGELIPLTLADWDAEAGTITLVVQGVGTSSIEINADGGRRGVRRHRRARWAARATSTATGPTRRSCSPPAASGCRRCTRSCGSTCAAGTTSR